jgi:hypothetical protein
MRRLWRGFSASASLISALYAENRLFNLRMWPETSGHRPFPDAALGSRFRGCCLSSRRTMPNARTRPSPSAVSISSSLPAGRGLATFLGHGGAKPPLPIWRSRCRHPDGGSLNWRSPSNSAVPPPSRVPSAARIRSASRRSASFSKATPTTSAPPMGTRRSAPPSCS